MFWWEVSWHYRALFFIRNMNGGCFKVDFILFKVIFGHTRRNKITSLNENQNHINSSLLQFVFQETIWKIQQNRLSVNIGFCCSYKALWSSFLVISTIPRCFFQKSSPLISVLSEKMLLTNFIPFGVQHQQCQRFWLKTCPQN